MERCKPKMQPRNNIFTPRSVREWTHTLASGLPLWEWESLWSPECSKRYCRGWNSLACRFPYTIGKLLNRKCLKWACMIHLSISTKSYGQKKGYESKCQFDSCPQKVKNRLEICGMPHIVEKLSIKVKTWLQTSPWLEVCIRSYGLPKCQNPQFQEFWNSRISSWRTKRHLNVAPMTNYKEYYKGAGGGFPQV
jgi:hypothetical protein